jgi:DNA-binding PadR family transcriptional regulator
MTSIYRRRSDLTTRTLAILDRGSQTLPRLLDALHIESGYVDRIDEKDLLPVLEKLLEDGVVSTDKRPGKIGGMTTEQVHYTLRVDSQ